MTKITMVLFCCFIFKLVNTCTMVGVHRCEPDVDIVLCLTCVQATNINVYEDKVKS